MLIIINKNTNFKSRKPHLSLSLSLSTKVPSCPFDRTEKQIYKTYLHVPSCVPAIKNRLSIPFFATVISRPVNTHDSPYGNYCLDIARNGVLSRSRLSICHERSFPYDYTGVIATCVHGGCALNSPTDAIARRHVAYSSLREGKSRSLSRIITTVYTVSYTLSLWCA